MKGFLRLLVVSALLEVSGVAYAQDNQPSADAVKRASEEFAAGKEAYRDEEYVEAAEHFEAADDHAPSVNAVRAAMTSRQNAGQLDRAATLAALALMRHPEDMTLAGEAQRILDEAALTLHRVEVTCDHPCSLVVGTSLVHGMAATNQIVYLNPGEHDVRASWAKQYATQTQSVVAIAEGTDTIEFSRPEPVEPEGEDELPPGVDEFGMDIDDGSGGEATARPEEDNKGLPRGLFVGGVVATVALGGVTVWSGLDTQNNPGPDEVKELCQDNPNYPDPTTCPAYETGQRKEVRTNVLIGATAAVGVATIIIGAVTDWRGKQQVGLGRAGTAASRSGVRPWVALDDGALLGVRGRF